MDLVDVGGGVYVLVCPFRRSLMRGDSDRARGIPGSPFKVPISTAFLTAAMYVLTVPGAVLVSARNVIHRLTVFTSANGSLICCWSQNSRKLLTPCSYVLCVDSARALCWRRLRLA